jgi:glycosyltransferase involved in cell wall biosynthesis
MAKYIVARGWALDVIARDPAALAVRDDGRLRRLPSNVRVFGVAAREHPVAAAPARLWKVLRRQFPHTAPRLTTEVRREELSKQSFSLRSRRAYLAWLDFVHQGGWARSAANLGTSLTQKGHYVAVVSSGPPHMAHEAGRLIARHARIPFIADFRDPWSLQERVGEQMASPVWFKLAERYESRAVRDAAVVSMNTDASRDAMQARYPEAADRIITVRNGCDDDPLPPGKPDDRFTIRFAGEIYIDRDPRLLFRAAARVVKEFSLTPEMFALLFIGDVSRFQGQPLEDIAREEGLIGGFVETGPYRPRDAALEFLASGSMLLSLPQDSRLAVPAKIYEYLRFDAWLLILADEPSATARVLRETDADVIAPQDVDGIARVIRHRYQQFARGERPRAVGADGRFDRSVQANVLLHRIAAAVSNGNEGRG